MKSFSLLTLTLALGLFAGCSSKTDPAAATAGGPAVTKSADGEAFLAANAKKDGVITTASGLQYKVLKSGAGESPKASDQVKVDYTGTLTDGTVFDSSVQRGQPAVFPVGAVIPGWVEALQLMKVGDKWQLFIPAKLAYGDQSPSPVIPANSVLVFEVELLGIEK
jgi:FKBP-type peptidyl-prolyl cis-trans isomerase FklB